MLKVLLGPRVLPIIEVAFVWIACYVGVLLVSVKLIHTLRSLRGHQISSCRSALDHHHHRHQYWITQLESCKSAESTHTSSAMLEATMILLDNSSFAINTDYGLSRWASQLDSAKTVFNTKINSNPENVVGIMTMAGSGCVVRVCFGSWCSSSSSWSVYTG